jgi:hypothetical protein
MSEPATPFDSGGKIRITVIKEKFNFYDFEQVVEMFKPLAYPKKQRLFNFGAWLHCGFPIKRISTGVR